MHSRQFFGMRGVNGFDSRMGMRTSENLAIQHAGQVNVGAIAGLTGHFVRAVVADGAFANHMEFLGR